jgi:hypothetical protein
MYLYKMAPCFSKADFPVAYRGRRRNYSRAPVSTRVTALSLSLTNIEPHVPSIDLPWHPCLLRPSSWSPDGSCGEPHFMAGLPPRAIIREYEADDLRDEAAPIHPTVILVLNPPSPISARPMGRDAQRWRSWQPPGFYHRIQRWGQKNPPTVHVGESGNHANGCSRL